MKKGFKIVISTLAALLIICGVLFAVYKLMLDPHRQTLKPTIDSRGGVRADVQSLPLDEMLTFDQAKEDIDYVMGMLRGRHPAWLEDDNERVVAVEAQYLAELDALDEKRSDGVTVLEEWRSLCRIMHELYDGHSNICRSYSGDRYIDDVSQIIQYGAPVKINGEPTEDVFERLLALCQYETLEWAKLNFGDFFTNEACLALAGVDTSDGVTFTFDTGNDDLDAYCRFVPPDEPAEAASSSDDSKWVYYSIDDYNKIGVFTLASCIYDDEYRATVKEFFNSVSEAGVEDVIVDLRNNRGGNSLVANEFIKYLDIDGYYTWACHVRIGNHLIKNKRSYVKNEKQDPAFSGGIYVLTNTATYSSALDFTMCIMDNGIGQAIGEPSGNLPDSYGDILLFATPNSRLPFSVSYKRWFRIDESKAGLPLEPDFPCRADEAKNTAYTIILNGHKKIR